MDAAVTANVADCSWKAVPKAAWLRVTSGTPGTGNGTVTYAVAASAGAATATDLVTSPIVPTYSPPSGTTFPLAPDKKPFSTPVTCTTRTARPRPTAARSAPWATFSALSGRCSAWPSSSR